MAFTFRTSNYNPSTEVMANQLFAPPKLKYTLGELNKNQLMDNYFPGTRNIVEIVNKDKRSLVYMVGSPAVYFIEENDRRVLSDTFMDTFDQLIKKYKSKEKIIEALKLRGFKYIICDLRMGLYDETPDKSLSRKFIQFQNTLYNNPKVDWLATDRKIKLNENGKVVFSVFPDKGQIVKYGTIAIFKIK